MMRAPLLVVLLVLLAGFFSCFDSSAFNRTSSPLRSMSALLWSDPTTWTGTANISPSTGVPQAGDAVTIPSGVTVCVDVDTADLGMVEIYGTLTADDTVDVELTADGIMVRGGGLLEIGTESQPFQHKFIFTINGADPGFQTAAAVGRSDNGLTGNAFFPAARGIMAMSGGSISLFGAVPNRTKTKIDEHAPAGTRRLKLVDRVDWKQGDRIALSTTDFYGYGHTEVFSLASDTAGGRDLKLTSALQASRWGRLQYVTSSGLSTEDDRTIVPSNDRTPTYLDERAEVVHLTRNIVIQAPDDAEWQDTTEGGSFGVHTMIMRGAVVARANGVEFVRCGQAQRIERYGWHWHVMNYQGGSFVGPASDPTGDLDPADHHVKNCTFYDSANRAVNIHGTCGVEVIETYAVKIRGHAFFMEDGTEERNVITDCVAMDVQHPYGVQDPSGTFTSITGSSQPNSLLVFQSERCIKQHDGRASGFWLTNPNNVVERNWASDCHGFGLWNSFSEETFGLTDGAIGRGGFQLVPNYQKLIWDPSRQNAANGWQFFGKFNDNVGHGCGLSGIATRDPVQKGSEAGQTTEEYFHHDLDSTASSGTTIVRGDRETVILRRNSTWKNNFSGYQNRVQNPEYHQWTMADNHQSDFTGAARTGTLPSALHGPLLVGYSLNNDNDFPEVEIYPFVDYRRPRKASASYHFFLNAYDIVAVNYPLEVTNFRDHDNPNSINSMKGGGGVLGWGDLYLHQFESFFFMPNWTLINSSGGYVSPPPYFNGYATAGPVDGVEANWSRIGNGYEHHALSTAIEDRWGYWGPAGWYLVPNDPFFTHDAGPGATGIDEHFGDANHRAWDGHTTASSSGPRVPDMLPSGTTSDPYGLTIPNRMFGVNAVNGRPSNYDPSNPNATVSNPSSASPGQGDYGVVLEVKRLNASTLAEVGKYVIGVADGFDFRNATNFPAPWMISSGQSPNNQTTGNPFPNGGIGSTSDPQAYEMDSVFGFRHFGAMNNGYYEINFPGNPNATDLNYLQNIQHDPPKQAFGMKVENLYRATSQGDATDDWVIFSIPWDGTVTPYGFFEVGTQGSSNASVTISNGMGRLMNATGSSLQDVINSSDGSVMWQDTANDRLWLKLAGGLSPNSGDLTNAELRALASASSLTTAEVLAVGETEYGRMSIFRIKDTAW